MAEPFSPRTSFGPGVLASIAERLRAASDELALHYPGATGLRQPVHTVYGGAQLFTAETGTRIGEVARRALDEYAPDFVTLARAIGLHGAEVMGEAAPLAAEIDSDPARARREQPEAWLAHAVHARV